MFDLPDLMTLRQCSTLCSGAYATVFFVMAEGRAWHRCWGLASLGYCASLIVAGLVGEPVPAIAQPALNGLLALSMALILAGVRCFDGRRGIAPWMWGVIAATVAVPTVARSIVGPGAVETAVWSLVIAACAAAFAVPLLLNDVTDGTARARRIAGWMLLLYVPIYLTGVVGMFLSPEIVARLAVVPYLADQLLFGAANLTLLWISSSRSQRQLRDMALRDPLTGVWNRAALAASAAELLVPGRMVLLIDVDRFKAINDGHGHAIGDRVLCEIATALQRSTGGDFVARLGGDEFLVVTDAADVAAIAMRASRGVAGLPAWTLSVGAALIEEDDRSIDAVIQRADLRMYGAKRQGQTSAAA
ncbi:GGDEF domain-containing protein [Sphingomonas sp. Leaf10]|uniref:GGDEF domain-containing protein n=1 Tax=Sphingomonas sp. Leaf10 TaxID=1735676 RepID=UPI0006FA59C3|nr:GGDEF domain-containing protein [Sphingomonas sp. Leaf10]KQM38041.1 hypothetical protein ASE59_12160 [Sphingomonas sp. Leaf10]